MMKEFFDLEKSLNATMQRFSSACPDGDRSGDFVSYKEFYWRKNCVAIAVPAKSIRSVTACPHGATKHFLASVAFKKSNAPSKSGLAASAVYPYGALRAKRSASVPSAVKQKRSKVQDTRCRIF